MSRDSRKLSWENGQSEPIQRGQHPWSFTGRTGPQPDGGERCLAILNSVYRYNTISTLSFDRFLCWVVGQDKFW